jgi:hypothetical protein
VLRALSNAKTEFILIGGFAAIAHVWRSPNYGERNGPTGSATSPKADACSARFDGAPRVDQPFGRQRRTRRVDVMARSCVTSGRPVTRLLATMSRSAGSR